MPKLPPQSKVPLSQAEKFAKEIAPTIKGGEIIALIGELGSGKTTFTKALGKALGISQSIPSPTFVMMQEFEIPKKVGGRKLFLYHLDLYRAKNFTEVVSLGITEWWGHPQAVTIIEWADKIQNHLPKDTKIIYLHRDINARKN